MAVSLRDDLPPVDTRCAGDDVDGPPINSTPSGTIALDICNGKCTVSGVVFQWIVLILIF